MRALFNARPVRATAFAFASVLGLAGPAFADFTVEFPDPAAGLPAGCPGFTLRVQGIGDSPPARRDTSEMLITAGRGSQLTFTNLNNSQTLSLRSNGSVSKSSKNADGTFTVQSTGHNVIVMFQTDEPAGPSTTLYTGRVTYIQDGTHTTILGTSGKSLDICGALK